MNNVVAGQLRDVPPLDGFLEPSQVILMGEVGGGSFGRICFDQELVKSRSDRALRYRDLFAFWFVVNLAV